MYPLSFSEFLEAVGEGLIRKAMDAASVEQPLADPLHTKLINLFKKFIIVGGMPEVVAAYAQERNLLECRHVLDDLIISLQDDFVKYRSRVPATRISEVFDSVVHQMGGKFVFRGSSSANHKQIKQALEVLIMAGLVIPVTHTSANGIPPGAEANEKRRKMLIYDTGIYLRMLDLNVGELLLADDFELINKGCLAELYVGLELLKSASCYTRERLWYWHREALNSNAEVDYVIQSGSRIVPLELKSGSRGAMRSLHLFMSEKESVLGIRFSLENFGSFGRIRVIPLYKVSAARRV